MAAPTEVAAAARLVHFDSDGVPIFCAGLGDPFLRRPDLLPGRHALSAAAWDALVAARHLAMTTALREPLVATTAKTSGASSTSRLWPAASEAGLRADYERACGLDRYSADAAAYGLRAERVGEAPESPPRPVLVSSYARLRDGFPSLPPGAVCEALELLADAHARIQADAAGAVTTGTSDEGRVQLTSVDTGEVARVAAAVDEELDDLSHSKAAGNAAFGRGEWAEALALYDAALAAVSPAVQHVAAMRKAATAGGESRQVLEELFERLRASVIPLQSNAALAAYKAAVDASTSSVSQRDALCERAEWHAGQALELDACHAKATLTCARSQHLRGEHERAIGSLDALFGDAIDDATVPAAAREDAAALRAACVAAQATADKAAANRLRSAFAPSDR